MRSNVFVLHIAMDMHTHHGVGVFVLEETETSPNGDGVGTTVESPTVAGASVYLRIYVVVIIGKRQGTNHGTPCTHGTVDFQQIPHHFLVNCVDLASVSRTVTSFDLGVVVVQHARRTNGGTGDVVKGATSTLE